MNILPSWRLGLWGVVGKNGESEKSEVIDPNFIGRIYFITIIINPFSTQI